MSTRSHIIHYPMFHTLRDGGLHTLINTTSSCSWWLVKAPRLLKMTTGFKLGMTSPKSSSFRQLISKLKKTVHKENIRKPIRRKSLKVTKNKNQISLSCCGIVESKCHTFEETKVIFNPDQPVQQLWSWGIPANKKWHRRYMVMWKQWQHPEEF